MHFDVLQPEVKAQKYRASVERPLGDQVAFFETVHVTPFEYRSMRRILTGKLSKWRMKDHTILYQD